MVAVSTAAYLTCKYFFSLSIFQLAIEYSLCLDVPYTTVISLDRRSDSERLIFGSSESENALRFSNATGFGNCIVYHEHVTPIAILSFIDDANLIGMPR